MIERKDDYNLSTREGDTCRLVEIDLLYLIMHALAGSTLHTVDMPIGGAVTTCAVVSKKQMISRVANGETRRLALFCFEKGSGECTYFIVTLYAR